MDRTSDRVKLYDSLRKIYELINERVSNSENALWLIRQSALRLRELKLLGGSEDADYIMVSTIVASKAVEYCMAGIYEWNELIERTDIPDEFWLEKGRGEVIQAWQAALNLKELDVRSLFREVDLPYFEKEVAHYAAKWGVEVDGVRSTLSMEVDEEGYFRCSSYQSKREFLAAHPHSPLRERVECDILEYERTRYPDEKSLDSLGRFIKEYPHSRLVEQAVGEIASILSSRLHSEQLYEAFMQRFPWHDACGRMAGLREVAAYKSCKTQRQLRQFLKRYPRSRFRDEALATLAWADRCHRASGQR